MYVHVRTPKEASCVVAFLYAPLPTSSMSLVSVCCVPAVVLRCMPLAVCPLPAAPEAPEYARLQLLQEPRLIARRPHPQACGYRTAGGGEICNSNPVTHPVCLFSSPSPSQPSPPRLVPPAPRAKTGCCRCLAGGGGEGGG
jgi:hypothetical protein